MNNNGYHSRRKSPDNGNTLSDKLSSLSMPIQQQVKSRRRNDGQGVMNNRENVAQRIVNKKEPFSRRKDEKGIIDRQDRFIDEYMKDFNGTQAAIRAGYSKKTSHVHCAWLLNNPKIKAAIQARRDKLAAKFELDREGIIERYKCLMDYDVKDFFDDKGEMKPLSQISARARYAIQGFKHNKKVSSSGKGDDKIVIEDFIKEFNLPAKRAVLDSVVKLLGLIPEEGNGKVNFNGPVQINIGFED